MALKKFVKDPQEVLDYTIDWSQWLVTNDTITAASVTAPSGITVTSPVAIQHTTTATTVWVSGGTAGSSYDIAVHVTTNGGRQGERSITIQCKEL